MSKIAICFFGQVKNFDQQLYDSFSINVSNALVNNDIDYFLVTYNNTHYTNSFHNENHPINYYSIVSFFPFKRSIILDINSDITKFIDNFVIVTLGSIGYARWGSYLSSQQCTIRAVRQLYGLHSLYKCLKDEDNYDRYIFVRPDCIFESQLDSSLINNSYNLCIPNFSNWDGYNDRFAITDSFGLEVYCSRYNRLMQHPQKYHSETFLKQTIDNYKATCYSFNNFRFRLLRTTGNLTDVNY